jgi:hypothetical protein
MKRKSLAGMFLAVAACAPVVTLATVAKAQDVSESWRTAVTSGWTIATRWTPEVVPDNGTPAGANYNATISVGNGLQTYSVMLNSNITIDNLTLDYNNATLNQGAINSGPEDGASSILTVNDTADVESGTYTFTDGALVAGNLELGGGGTINLNSADGDSVEGFINAQNVDLQSGTINFNGPPPAIPFTPTLTIGGGIVNGTTFGGNFVPIIQLDTNGTGVLYAQSSLTAQSSSPGFLFLAPGTSLCFDGSSPGGIALNNFAVFGGINGPPTGNPLGSTTIYASGPDSGGSQTLTIGSGSGVIGAVNFLNYGNHLDTLYNSGTISDVTGDTFGTNISVNTFTNNYTVESNGGTVNVNVATFTNTLTGVVQANPGGLVTINTTNFSNSGTIEAIGQGPSSDDGTLTINAPNFTNTGTVEAFNGGTLVISSATPINGNFQVTDFSTLVLSGSYTPTQFNTAESAALADVDGTSIVALGGTVNMNPGRRR